MRKSLITAVAVGALSAGSALSMAAHAAGDPGGSPGHYSNGCQAASQTYKNDGSGANPAGNGLPNQPTVDTPVQSLDTGWTSPPPPNGDGQTHDNGNGVAIGVSGSDGYLEVAGDPSPAGHISGGTAGQAGAVPLNGYIGNDKSGNGTVCVAGTTVVP